MSISKRKVLKVRRYKAGYEIRDELVDGSAYGGSDFETKTAYTSSGDYIGNTKFAYRLCKKWGIAPEMVDPEHSVCSIGFCEKDQKWYGWSHRALFGFGVGSITKKGNCGFTPSNVLEIYATLSEDEKGRVVSVDADGITIEHTTYSTVPVDSDDSGYEELMCSESSGVEHHIIKVGRGEWTAETLADAKQMAIDFARSVNSLT